MKKSLIILTLIFIAFNSNSQQIKNNSYELSSEDHFVKSKKRLKTGLILLGGGVVMFAGGSYALEHGTGKSGYGALFILGGMAMAATSIPFFISSASSKHKANLYMRKEALMLSPNLEAGIVYNSIGVKIDLGKD